VQDTDAIQALKLVHRICCSGSLDLMCVYAITIFLSAFLLFQLQPIIAGMVLPWFGGSSA
jgi:hypothetical protein